MRSSRLMIAVGLIMIILSTLPSWVELGAEQRILGFATILLAYVVRELEGVREEIKKNREMQ